MTPWSTVVVPRPVSQSAGLVPRQPSHTRMASTRIARRAGTGPALARLALHSGHSASKRWGTWSRFSMAPDWAAIRQATSRRVIAESAPRATATFRCAQ